MPTSGVVETSKSKGVRSKGDAISSWHDDRRHDPCAGAAKLHFLNATDAMGAMPMTPQTRHPMCTIRWSTC